MHFEPFDRRVQPGGTDAVRRLWRHRGVGHRNAGRAQGAWGRLVWLEREDHAGNTR